MLLRQWRRRRGLSQLALAGAAGVSARHLSFLETGRARPSRAMLLRLGEHLDVPLRDRNALLLAAGLAPAYPERGLGDPPWPLSPTPSRAARRLRAVPGAGRRPALGAGRRERGRRAADRRVRGRLLEPPCNVLRLCLHPDGLAPRIPTLGSWRAHLLGRLRHQIAATGDPALAALLDELRAYPAPPADRGPAHAAPVVPVRLRDPDGRELAFLSTTTLFGTPGDVTVAELAIEAFLPADDATAAALGAPRPALRPAPATA